MRRTKAFTSQQKRSTRRGKQAGDCGKEAHRSWYGHRKLKKWVLKDEVDGVGILLKGHVPGRWKQCRRDLKKRHLRP